MDIGPPIALDAAENRVWTEVAGLFRPEPDSNDEASAPVAHRDLNITGLFWAYFLASRESSPLSDFVNQARRGTRGSGARKLT